MTAPAKRQRRADAAPGGGVVDLLVDILFGQPRLTDAACRTHVGLFDQAADGNREAAEEAVAVCGRCPVVDQCAAWSARTHPRRPPPGVWAGTYQPPPTSRKRKTA